MLVTGEERPGLPGIGRDGLLSRSGMSVARALIGRVTSGMKSVKRNYITNLDAHGRMLFLFSHIPFFSFLLLSTAS